MTAEGLEMFREEQERDVAKHAARSVAAASFETPRIAA
jgi:hypothetical protein